MVGSLIEQTDVSWLHDKPDSFKQDFPNGVTPLLKTPYVTEGYSWGGRMYIQACWSIFSLQWPAISFYALIGKE